MISRFHLFTKYEITDLHRHDIMYSGGNACVDGREGVSWHCFFRSIIIY